MASMENRQVVHMGPARDRRIARAADARRRLEGEGLRAGERDGGRMWLNGGELGGARAAFAHLAATHD
jgi:hypothetical protein